MTRIWSTVTAKVGLLVVLALFAAAAPAGLALWVAGGLKRTIVSIHRDKMMPLESLQQVETFLARSS
jgi:hypothetical protein